MNEALIPKKHSGLLLSAYDAGSHRYWRKGIEARLNEFDWTVLTLPARYFNWRIRGNPISFIEQFSAELSREYDFVIATSMVDLATLRGLIPSLANTPSLIYFHENQFEYPQSDKQNKSIEPQMVNLYSALAADQLVFNSDFNRTSFFKGCDELMAKLPDYTFNDLSQRLYKKSSVIPVPISDGIFSLPLVHAAQNTSIKLIWNHRWEYDKGPDRLLCFLQELELRGVDFEINIVGEKFRKVPSEFELIKGHFSDQINYFGYIDNVDDYWALLSRCDVVLSTAIHEFQGVSVMEAVAAGCLPLVPNRLSYSELINEQYRYDSDLNFPEKEAIAAVDLLLKISDQLYAKEILREEFKQYSWSSLIGCYRKAIQNLPLYLRA